MSARAEALPRPRGLALWIAACTLWLPCLVPLLLGMLSDCGHCLWTYAKVFAMVPGVLLPVLLQLDDGWFVLAGAGATLALLFGLYLAARELPRLALYALQAIVLVAVSVEATLLANLLRM